MSKDSDPELSNRLSLGASDEMLAEIDEWRRKQPNIPTRAAAARMLLQAALKGVAPPGAGMAGTGKGSGKTTSVGRAKAAAPVSPALAEMAEVTNALRCDAPPGRQRVEQEDEPQEEVRAVPARRGPSADRPRQLQ